MEKRPKYAQLLKTKFFVANSKRSDRNSTTKKWLESVNFLEPAPIPTNGHKNSNSVNGSSTNPFLSKSSNNHTPAGTNASANGAVLTNGNTSNSTTNASWFGASAWNDIKPRSQGQSCFPKKKIVIIFLSIF